VAVLKNVHVRFTIVASLTSLTFPFLAGYQRMLAKASSTQLRLLLPFAVFASLIHCPLQNVLANEALDHAVVAALLRMPPGTLDKHPEQRATVLRFLERKSGTRQYLDVAQQLGVLEQTEPLVKLLTALPSSSLGVDAGRLLAESGQVAVIEAALNSDNDEQAVAAAVALGFVNDAQVRKLLRAIVADLGRSRTLRTAASSALGRSLPGQRMLLEMVQAQPVDEAIQFAITDALLSSNNDEVKSAAAKILTPPASATAEVIPPLQQLVKMRGDAAAGQLAFNTVGTCSKCHKVRGEGKEVGPELSEIGSKLSREDMYVAILNPSAAVSHNFETYTLLDTDGQVATGLLVNQNDRSVTIRNAEGIDTSVSRERIELLKKQPLSLMPADLQKAMSLKNLVDVVEYMAMLRKPGEDAFQVLATEAAIDRDNPQSALDGFEVAAGLEIQLFAAEPQLLSPTSIDVDHLGRVWVCEAVNYRHFRNPDNAQRSEGDRILVLEDTNGDGQADKQTVFYQGTDIDSAHGVTVLGKQVIVSAGSQVLIFTDEDGDLKPESKRPLFTGIAGVQHDHGIHAFNIGPDGKLYFNFGNEGKQLKTAAGETIVDKAGNRVEDSRQPYQQGMVFRCNLDGSELETLGWNFRNNWELCVDSFGNMWQSDNDDDGNRGTRINFVMEFGNYGYRDELTGDTWQVPRIGLEAEKPLQHWHLNDPGVVPNILQTGAGSPTGICFYEGTLLPAPFQNQIIHTDPGPNVVRAYPVEPDGAGYKASILNLVQGVKDPWFRPVDVCVAPDGSLFVADWYDPGVGGHRMGDVQHGRIFRIVPTGHQGYQVPPLDLTQTASVLDALFSPNLATRFLAQQKLQELGSGAREALADAVQQAPTTALRARALWQLALVSGQPAAQVETALGDASPDLRIVGIRLARQHNLDLIPIIDQLKRDPAVSVRRELVIALRHHPHPRAAELWADLASQHDGHDRWYVEALGIGADRQWERYFDAWLNQVGEQWDTPAGRDIIWRSRSPKACMYLARIIAATPSEEEQYRYFRALDFHPVASKLPALEQLLAGFK
jgi:putative membrane-bound dehydrogenase-like protein